MMNFYYGIYLYQRISMNWLNNLKIRNKMLLLGGILCIGIILIGWVAYRTVESVRVNGLLYMEIVRAKDLVADILPPPEYLVESFLVALRMTVEKNPAELERLISRSASLQKEYENRHGYWEKELKDPVLRKTLLEDSYIPAEKYFLILNENLIPALRSGKNDLARKLADGELRQNYECHRIEIDRVVVLANDWSLRLESQARNAVKKGIQMMLLVIVLVLAAVLTLVFMLSQSLANPIELLTRAISLMHAGQLANARRLLSAFKKEQ
jgi:methyl-accepting chemotaxis protein